jgi:hypothetical protein
LAEDLSYSADDLAASLGGTAADELDAVEALAVADLIRCLTRETADLAARLDPLQKPRPRKYSKPA